MRARREPPLVDAQRRAAVTQWSLRLRLVAEAEHELARTVARSCDDAGLVGPAGDALRELAQQVAAQARAAAHGGQVAADELDHHLAAAPPVPASGGEHR